MPMVFQNDRMHPGTTDVVPALDQLAEVTDVSAISLHAPNDGCATN